MANDPSVFTSASLASVATEHGRAGRWAEAAEAWRMAATYAIGYNRASRYREAARRCARRAAEADSE